MKNKENSCLSYLWHCKIIKILFNVLCHTITLTYQHSNIFATNSVNDRWRELISPSLHEYFVHSLKKEETKIFSF